MRKEFILITLIFSVLSACHSTINEPYNVILIAGQSNTHYGTGFEPNLDCSIDGIKQLGRFGDDNMKVVDAVEPLQYNSREVNRIGFGLTYAKLLQEYLNDNKKIIIIPCAYWGTGFQDNHWNKGNGLYEDAVNRVKYVMSHNPESKLVSILWHQGEEDIGFSNYQNDLDDFIVNIRTDLQADSIPFIVGGMVPFWVNKSYIRKKHQLIISNSVNRHRCVGYADPELPFVIEKDNNIVDEIHYNSKGQRELGRRYFEEFKKLIE